MKKSQELEILNYAIDLGVKPELIEFVRRDEIKPYKFIEKIKHLISKFRNRFETYRKEETIIIINNSKFFILIESKVDKYDGKTKNIYTYSCPASRGLSESKYFSSYDNVLDWTLVNNELVNWLELAKKELAAIATIDKLISIPDFIEYGQFEYEEKFTTEERKVLKSGIENLRQKISVEFDLTDYKLNLINTKLDELSTKVDSINKFDFKSAFFGLMVNIASSVLYDNVGAFWTLVKGIFPKSIPQNEV